MNIDLLAELAKTNPALARAIELSIYATLGYVVWIAGTWEVFSSQALIQAAIVPLMAYFSKKQRDLSKWD